MSRLNWKITVATASILLVLALTAAALWSLSAARRGQALSIHSLQVRAHLRQIRSSVLQAESAQRGYLLLHEKTFLETFVVSAEDARAQLRSLRDLVVGSTSQASRAAAIAPLLEAKLVDLQQVMETHDRDGSEAAVVRVGRHVGERLKAEIFDFLAAAEAEEAGHAVGRQQAIESSSDLAQTYIAIGGTVALFLAVLTVGFIRRDISELTQKAAIIREQNGALEEQKEVLASQSSDLARSNRDLDQFAYVASHDLKAPLRGIANLATWLEEDLGTDLPAASKKNLELLRGRVHRLEALIDGILAYSRAGRSAQESAYVDVDVNRLVKEVVELAAPPATTRVQIDGSLPRLRTDKTALQQVFMNLVGNAIEHGDPTACTVSVSGAREHGAWTFHVSDNGPGIAPEFHERIFGLFQTLAPRDRVEGSGIGLAVVQKLVEVRGGKVWVESQPGQGARFSFTWKESDGIS